MFYIHSREIALLTLKGPITTAADDSLKYFFHCFSEKRLDIDSHEIKVTKKKKALAAAILLGSIF